MTSRLRTVRALGAATNRRVLQPLRRRLARDDGNAIIEFVFVALVMLVPLIYLVAGVASVQRVQLAVTQAARNAGRAYAMSDTAAEAEVRVRAAVRLALADQGLPDDAQLRFVAAGRACTDPPITPRVDPGAEFEVCVTHSVQLPAVPKLFVGRFAETGVYIVHVDDFRSATR